VSESGLDKQTTTDYFFSVVLAYIGTEIYQIVVKEKMVEFTFVIEKDEFQTLLADYIARRLLISDARSFGEKHKDISRLVREAKVNGGSWKNSDLVYYERQMKLSDIVEEG
jgi:23S rRNA maturation mini-RNase III